MSKESLGKEAQIEALKSGIKTREKELIAMRKLLLELEPIQSPNPPIQGIPPEEHFSFNDENEYDEGDLEEADPKIELARRRKHEGLVAIFEDIFGGIDLMEKIKKEEVLKNILGRVQIQTNLFHHANALINRNKRQTPELSKLLSELYPECLAEDEADAEVYLGIVKEEMKLELDTELKHLIAKASKPTLDAIAKKIKADSYLEIAYSNAKHVLAENNPGIQEVSRKAVIDIMLEDILARGDKSLRARLLRICNLIK